MPSPEQPSAPARFVQVSEDGTHFVVDGRPFFFAGANCYYLMTRAAEYSLRHEVIDVLDSMAAAGLTVLRTWAFNDGDEWNALQPEPGMFDQRVFRGLDFVLVEAQKRNIRVILSLVNYWGAYGGMAQYVRWSFIRRGLELPPEVQPDMFYDDPHCQDVYHNFLAVITARRNSISGVVYSEDPTIMAWELANEPRCEGDFSGSRLQNWVSDTAEFLKSLDSNHMVGTGSEGFFGSSTPDYLPDNPFDVMSLGCDFLRNHAPDSIDFASAHLWPDTWLSHADDEHMLNFTRRWINAHVDVVREQLGKPLILGEFGKRPAGHRRATFYDKVLSRVEKHAKSGHGLVGAILWSAADLHYPDYDGFTVYLRPPHCPAPMPPENPGAKNHSIVRARSTSTTPSGRGTGDALESSTSLPEPSDGATPRTPDGPSPDAAEPSDVSRQLFTNGDSPLQREGPPHGTTTPAGVSHRAAAGADGGSGERGRAPRGGGTGQGSGVIPGRTGGRSEASEAVHGTGGRYEGRPGEVPGLEAGEGASPRSCPLPENELDAADSDAPSRSAAELEGDDQSSCPSITRDPSDSSRVHPNARAAGNGAAAHPGTDGHDEEGVGECVTARGSPEERQSGESRRGVSEAVAQDVRVADADGGGVGDKADVGAGRDAREVETCGAGDEEEEEEGRRMEEERGYGGAMHGRGDRQQSPKPGHPGDSDDAADVYIEASMGGVDSVAVEASGDRLGDQMDVLGSADLAEDEEGGWQSPFDKQSGGGEEGIFGSTTTDAELVAPPEDMPVARSSDSATVQRVFLFAEEMAALNRRAAKDCIIM